MILIAAMGANLVIGSGAGMPWSVPEEYAQFLAFIEGQTVIMGRRSWEIFGADLTSAHNVVVSRSAREIQGAVIARSIEHAVELARATGKTVFSAGGARIYEQTLPLADALYLSTIKGDFEGDARFPTFDPSDWSITRHDDHPRFEFTVYQRG